MSLTPKLLEERLLAFAVCVCEQVRRLPRDPVGRHIGVQLLRSATSPAANYAEARSAESRRDFVHKLQIGLKELRETAFWLELAARLHPKALDLRDAIRACDELISIFVKSVTTARKAGSRTNSQIVNRQS